MNVFLVTSSVNELVNIYKFRDDITAKNCTVIVVDEGDITVRNRNISLLDGLRYEFYGPKERKKWFAGHFSNYSKYASVIPKRCHAETSFGFLAALEQGADIILQIDDDVFPFKDEALVEGHIKNLSYGGAHAISSTSRWYNTLDSLLLNRKLRIWPRGYPYSLDARSTAYDITDGMEESVLNMGLWAGDPDLDSLTITQLGGMNGKSPVKSSGLKDKRIILGKGTFFSACSMNMAFRTEIVPSFYQLYMKEFGIDRFDDIWSGIFLKKIADHLGDRVSVGAPIVVHEKRPRDVFKDLRSELEGIIINEKLWHIVDSLELIGTDYRDCYVSLIDSLATQIGLFGEKMHRDFVKLQVKKMRLWLDVVDRIR